MAAVKDQSARYERLQKNFAKNLSRQLNNLFIHQVRGNTGVRDVDLGWPA